MYFSRNGQNIYKAHIKNSKIQDNHSNVNFTQENWNIDIYGVYLLTNTQTNRETTINSRTKVSFHFRFNINHKGLQRR